MRQEQNITQKIDWVTVGLYMAIVFMGWLNIFAVTYHQGENQSIFDLSLNSGRQLMFIVTSGILVAAILIIDRQFYETFAYIIYGFILFLLLLVPIIGKEVGGNKAWLGIGSFGVQPSEFAKFATVLVVAKFIGSIGFRMDNLRNQAVLFALIGAPMLLILLQKDYGTAMVFLVFLIVFYREGMSPFLILIGLGAAAIFILTLLVENTWILYIGIGVIWAVAILMNRRKKLKTMILITAGAIALVLMISSVDIVFNLLEDHHQRRIVSMLNPDSDPLGYGWNVTQSKIAIGSGGFFGKGFLEGTQTKFNFVPEQSTDFIFCTIGEEHGWIGSLFTIALFIALLLRVVFLAERQKNRFARVYGYSVACIFFFHFAVNIGMTVGLFPVIGIPLPFFSYGGSSLWGFTILLFIFLKLDAHRMQVLQRL
ncbi:rod shape-determining protein RodA [Fulvivirgaceae bacterium PWU4]|uniref:Cell wall polymerase n=1 Tax=Chryseosolibacter histidini TaxID=2782349 RepID=A0AAP2DNK8_9BACT|nr:rod shape-determining protein RodA [Chryseosolibacter histidini]MBT1699596.1 rod shape-determining protein RodA [Chryseosolibacter histidini]